MSDHCKDKMFKVEILTEQIIKKLETSLIHDYVKISPKNDPKKFCIMPKHYADNYLEKVKNMDIFEDDVWVVTFPKCGTTWAQEMVWMIGHDLDYNTSMEVSLDERFPFIDGLISKLPLDIFEKNIKMPRPRYIKSHLPLFLLPDQLWTVKPKIIYVVRNPKDTAVSWYHHNRHLHGYQGTKSEFLQAFVKELVLYSPMNDHVNDFWNIRDDPNVLFLFFEDMKRNLDQEVKKVMKFMQKDFSQDKIDKLCVHLSFDSIKNNKMVNKEMDIRNLMQMMGGKYDPRGFTFIRKGEVGGYKEELSQEEIKMFNEYEKYPKFKEFGFDYKY